MVINLPSTVLIKSFIDSWIQCESKIFYKIIILKLKKSMIFLIKNMLIVLILPAFYLIFMATDHKSFLLLSGRYLFPFAFVSVCSFVHLYHFQYLIIVVLFLLILFFLTKKFTSQQIYHDLLLKIWPFSQKFMFLGIWLKGWGVWSIKAALGSIQFVWTIESFHLFRWGLK